MVVGGGVINSGPAAPPASKYASSTPCERAVEFESPRKGSPARLYKAGMSQPERQRWRDACLPPWDQVAAPLLHSPR